MKQTIWLVVTNAVKAEFYDINKKEFVLVDSLTHPDSKLKTIELKSDEPGHYKTNHKARGQFEPPSDAHEEEHRRFAREVMEFLESHQQKNTFQKLILCAEPHFLGLLNKAMTESVHALVIHTVKKDLIPLPKAKFNAAIEAIIEEERFGVE